MVKVVLQCKTTAGKETCGLCRGSVQVEPGHQLRLADADEAVCSPCARKHAPDLVALLRLSDTAARVGKCGYHGVFPPMMALLDLARAAEEYLRATKPAGRVA